MKDEILENLLKLHTTKSYPDVALVVEGQKLEAHRIILAAQSKVLNSLLYGAGFLETLQYEVPVEAPLAAMKMLLEFVYSGELDLRTRKLGDIINLLELAHRFEFTSLEKVVADYLAIAVDAENAVNALEIATLIGQGRLTKQCWTLIEMLVEGIYEIDFEIPFRLMVDLMDFKPRRVSEIKLFQAVHRMASKAKRYTEEEIANLVARIDLTKMTASQIIEVVAPTNLINGKDILKLMAQNPFLHEATNLNAGLMPIDKIATVTKGSNPQYLFQQQKGLFCSHEIGKGEENSIIVDLNFAYIINHMAFFIDRKQNRYKIRFSRDNENWNGLVDMTLSRCNENQDLYFSDTIARYIQFQGLNADEDVFEINSLKISYVADPPKSLGCYIVPQFNVATDDKSAVGYHASINSIVRETQLLDGNKEDKGVETPYTLQEIGKGYLVIELNQPCILSSCRFRLWDYDGRQYSYEVKLTANFLNFDIISDKREEFVKGWQRIDFSPRIVSRFHFYPTKASKGNELRIVHFEAPAQE